MLVRKTRLSKTSTFLYCITGVEKELQNKYKLSPLIQDQRIDIGISIESVSRDRASPGGENEHEYSKICSDGSHSKWVVLKYRLPKER